MTSTPHYTDGDITLWHGDALTIAQGLPPASVQTIITSPPYFGLRDYGHHDQLGAEATVQDYVGNLVALFRELRRVLADDGTLWLNLGDSYAGQAGGEQGRNTDAFRASRDGIRAGKGGYRGLPSKNLIGVPWRVAFGLQDDGWILRSDIIWAKPNPMPESVTDRPTKAHEYVFLLAKSPRYYYDSDAIAEPAKLGPGDTWEERKAGGVQSGNRGALAGIHSTHIAGGHNLTPQNGLRNRRSVWEIPTAPFPGAHFAVYPPDLIRPCILAGSRPGDTILDPFSGSGTTGMVANYEGRKYVGIDVNADYLDLSLRTRFAAPALNIWDDENAS